MNQLTEGDVIRRYPDGRYTEAEALYVAGMIRSKSNRGFVPDDMREWWHAINAIAPAWLTSEKDFDHRDP